MDLLLALTVPEQYVQQHLQLLAELAVHFGDAEFRAALRGAADVDDLSRRLLGGDALRSGARA